MKTEYFGRMSAMALMRIIQQEMSNGSGSNWIGGNLSVLAGIKFEVDVDTGQLKLSTEGDLPGIELRDGYIYLTINESLLGGGTSLNLRGEYVAGETYTENDIVQYLGSGYVCLTETTAEPLNSDDWMLLVQKGQDGKDGTDGRDGTNGAMSFNGRIGNVLPEAGDYTADMIGAASTTKAEQLTSSMNDLDARLTLLELMHVAEVEGNPFTVTFSDMTSLSVSGVWNTADSRIEF